MNRLLSRIDRDTRVLLTTRALRGFADGVVSVLLASYLSHLGFDAIEVGTIVAGTLLGSAALTLGVGLAAHRWRRRPVLMAACALMIATGIGFAAVSSFWAVLIVAVVGTLNPSAGDVTLFLPAEQSALAQTARQGKLTSGFAWYNLAGALGGACGALASGLPIALAKRYGWSAIDAERFGFIAYSAIGFMVLVLYRMLSPAIELGASSKPGAPLSKSRAIVLRLTALFSLDSFAGGFVVQSLLVLWLYHRFQLSPESTGAIFFASGLLGALSQLVSSRLADRIGRINTMVFTHLPASIFLILAAFMPNAGLAILFLLLRAALSSMDVPARQSYVMAVVPPEERAAASSVTNVPRSLASAISPILSGFMLDRSVFGWPLIACGALKVAYDLLLLRQFSQVVPSDEASPPVRVE